MISPDKTVNFDDWINSLRIDLNTQNEIVSDVKEEEWKVWGNSLINNSPTLQHFGIPPTDYFSDWREWGKIVAKYF